MRLLDYGIGLKDIIKDNDKGSIDDRDIEQLKRNIVEYKPRIIAFNGKKGIG